MRNAPISFYDAGMRPLAPLLAGLALLGTGCSSLFPDPVEEDVRMIVLAYDPGSEGGSYRIGPARIKTLEKLRTLEGDAAKLLGGGQFSVDAKALAASPPSTAAALNAATTVREGKPVDYASFTVQGVVHPEDFHSLYMGTLYFNLEAAHLYFVAAGAPLYSLPVQYQPEWSGGPGAAAPELTGKIFWEPFTRQFVVLPFDEGAGLLPAGMNAGVVAHEFAHAVFSSRFFPDDAPVPWLHAEAAKSPETMGPVLNLMRAVDEGMADLFGALISGDPAFVRKSSAALQDARRVDPTMPRCLSSEARDNLALDAPEIFDPYPVGSVISAALYEAIAVASQDETAVARSLVDAERELGLRFAERGESMSLADVVDVLNGSTMLSRLKPHACGHLLDRLGLDAADVPSCSTGDVQKPERQCP
jgi:hypothetical protein